tara:strand:- start:1198 stop:1494 length:297 start_codon:yes stop_codon:yes gene_type:complete
MTKENEPKIVRNNTPESVMKAYQVYANSIKAISARYTGVNLDDPLYLSGGGVVRSSGMMASPKSQSTKPDLTGLSSAQRAHLSFLKARNELRKGKSNA